MGYCTNYNISVYKGSRDVLPCVHKNNDGANYCSTCGVLLETTTLEEVLEDQITEFIGDYGNPFNDSCKWYEHDEHMRRFSRLYPTVVFLLEGEGEEAGDIWKKYYKNGKMQNCKAKIIFDEFDESKLV